MPETTYLVTQTQIIKAKNKGNAEALVGGDDDIPGAVLGEKVDSREIDEKEAARYFTVINTQQFIPDYNLIEDEEEEELPDFKKMTKKVLDDWALERGIELDRRQTKANMIKELNKKL